MEVVEASEGRGVGVSSSRVRKAVREGEGVEGLVTDGIRGYIEREGLYKE
jgi:nicotinic acid mononucleotide adenylyltransferase